MKTPNKIEVIIGKMRVFSRKDSTPIAIWYRLCKESGRKWVNMDFHLDNNKEISHFSRKIACYKHN
jgi:hypothetical protein